MWGWIAGGIVATLVIVWGFIAPNYPASGANGSMPSGSGCDSCKGLDWWWVGLSWFKKGFMFGVYQNKRSWCQQQGCSTGL